VSVVIHDEREAAAAAVTHTLRLLGDRTDTASSR
jgi:hypothetical protein